MSDTLLSVFERFCDDLPERVRDDLLFMMAMLSDEDLIVEELNDVDEGARALFGARTPIGRIGNLIRAASIFDVYFAMDTHERFGLDTSKFEQSGMTCIHSIYADWSRAIQGAKEVWIDLRRTTLSPEAIAIALRT
jgi:hypothetical protein